MHYLSTSDIGIDHVIDSGRVHTHGMDEAGFPELEVGGVPTYFARAAADLLNHVCNYMFRSGNRLRPGDTLQIDDHTILQFEQPAPEEGNADRRLQIVEYGMSCTCCGARTSFTPVERGIEETGPAHAVSVVLTDREDTYVSGRITELAESHGGLGLGRHERILREGVEVELYEFGSSEAAEAFARACDAEAGVEEAEVLASPGDPTTD